MSDQASSLLSQALMIRERSGMKLDGNIVTLSIAGPEAPAAPATVQPPGRDWLSAVELVKEASEAIRIAEARNGELQAGLDQVLKEASEEIEELKSKLRATMLELAQTQERAGQADRRAGEAEKRASEAERRIGQADRRANEAEKRALEAERHAGEAEAWLCRLHDTIVNAFGPMVRNAAVPETQEGSRPAEAIG